MIRLSRKAMTAVEAVALIALRDGPEPVQSQEISRRLGAPRRYLEPAMQHLVREGVLRGVRGPRGGYVLSRDPSHLSVGEIVRLIAALDATEQTEPTSRSDLAGLLLDQLWEDAHADLLARLDGVTIDALRRAARAAGAASADAP